MSETTAVVGRVQWTKINGRWRRIIAVEHPTGPNELVTAGTDTALEGKLLDALAAAQRENELYANLRRAFVNSAKLIYDTSNTVRASITVSRYLPADMTTCEVLEREFDSMVAALRGEGGG